MKELEERLRLLKLRKVQIFSNIEALSEVNDSMYVVFGKTVAEIMKLEKSLIRETENNLNEN